MIIVLTSLLAIAVIAFVLRVRPQDLPPVETPSPFAHLDERKAAIYENLRDLQFEYRVGKLSDSDYQSTKTDLQKQLAAVLAEVDRIRAGGTARARAKTDRESAGPRMPALRRQIRARAKILRRVRKGHVQCIAAV